jgi:cytochrome c peroxidase
MKAGSPGFASIRKGEWHMKRAIFFGTALAVAALMYAGMTVSSVQAKKPVQQTGDIVDLGRSIFFDKNLSVNKNQSCADCHDPGVGFTGPDTVINAIGSVEPGSVGERFGNRKPPAASYAGESPILYYDESVDNGTGNEAGAWIGGMFWDGRATGETLGDPLAEQAMGPFTNTLEMAMPDSRQVCIRVSQSDYASLFEAVWGEGSLDPVKDEEGTYERIAHSIAAYERSTEVNPFSSKFDRFYDNAKNAGKDITKIRANGIPGGMMGGGQGGGGGGGNAQNNPARWEHYQNLGLTDDELKGLAVFNDPNRGNCASCHSLEPGSGGYPLFTDFSYHNLGIPRNPDNPYYGMPSSWNPDGEAWVDPGLGGYLKNAGYDPAVYEKEMGKFKTPTLRNVDLRPYPEFVKAYGHNGFFKSLDAMDGIIHFYAWRAMMDNGGMGGGGGGGMTPNPDMFPAPELDQNRIQMVPFNFMMDGARLTAFLKTLSDGYEE